MSSQRVYLVVRPPCAAYIAITFKSPLSCASPDRSPLLMGAPGAHCGLRRTPLAHPSRLMLGIIYNHLGGRPGVLGAACRSQFGIVPSTFGGLSSMRVGCGHDTACGHPQLKPGPRGSPAAEAGPSWVGGTSWRPSGEIWRENGLGFGASIGLMTRGGREKKKTSQCQMYVRTLRSWPGKALDVRFRVCFLSRF
jgi:hypothetical protein